MTLVLSPVGAGVGPTQLVRFPHQKTSEYPVEDVPLLLKSKYTHKTTDLRSKTCLYWQQRARVTDTTSTTGLFVFKDGGGLKMKRTSAANGYFHYRSTNSFIKKARWRHSSMSFPEDKKKLKLQKLLKQFCSITTVVVVCVLKWRSSPGENHWDLCVIDLDRFTF